MKSLNRWFYAVIGVAVLLFSGMVYAWSVLSSPIAQEFPQWTKAQLSLTFTIVMMFFCVGCMVGGFIAKKVEAKIYIWISAVLFLAGFFISSKTQGLTGLYLGFGVLCGFASGFSYSAVLGTVGKWFPDKQGLISGILLMGFGISSFIIGKIYQAATPSEIGGWRGSFLVLGIVIAIAFAVCGFFVVKPGSDFKVEAGAKQKKMYVNPVAMELPTKDMLKEASFWLFYLWAILVSAGGLTVTSQAGGIAREVGSDINAGTIATAVGLISVANGVSRVIMGGMYDKVGRSKIMQAVNLLFILAGAVLLLALSAKSFALIVLGFIIGGVAYGGVTPTNSAFISNYFGMKNYPLNLSMVNTNLLIASFGSTVAGALYDRTQSFTSACIMIIVLAALGILASFGINMADKKKLAKMGK